MDEASIWRPHLKPGERIVWSGEESRAWIRSAHALARLIRFVWAGIGVALAVFIGYRFYETALDFARQPNLSSGVGAPLYLLFTLAFAAVGVFSFLRLRRPPREPERYAITDQRVIVLDPQGRLTGQMARRRIGVVRINGQRLILTGTEHDDEPDFTLVNLDDPAAAKAALEKTFLEPAP
jgi:uncharacterized membrane protein YbhN (UPF0104 family)